MSVADVAISRQILDSARSDGCYNSKNPSGHCSTDSILIYLTVAGSVIPMRVLESDSIASVKLRIQKTCNKEFVVKRQMLVFEGRELSRNSSLVREYGIACGNVLHLVLRLSDLVLITIKTICGNEFEFYVDRYKNVGYLRKHIAENGQFFADVSEQELFINGEKLDDLEIIDDFCYDSDSVIHPVVQKSAKFSTKSLERDVELLIVTEGGDRIRSNTHQIESQSKEKDFLLEPLIVNPKVKLPIFAMEMIRSISEGLLTGKQPVRSSEGTGGTYFMPDYGGNKYIAVFKPIDEEPMAINNPQGLPLSSNGEGLRRGTRVGEGAVREVAAYILDHPKNGPHLTKSNGKTGFSGVPPTVMVRCMHKAFNYPSNKFDCSKKNVKIGSLQMFMRNFGSCEDLGPRDFPVQEVHKISVIDIRTANADRHAGNILASKENGRIVLTPIDNGYCLPETFDDCTFDWLYWPQAKEPFSADTIEYIKSLDAEQDIALLKFYGWDLSVECKRTLRISTILLKKGAEQGLSPFTIGSIMCRETLNKESIIEEIVNEAQDSILPCMSESAFIETVSKIMDIRLDMIVK